MSSCTVEIVPVLPRRFLLLVSVVVGAHVAVGILTARPMIWPPQRGVPVVRN